MPPTPSPLICGNRILSRPDLTTLPGMILDDQNGEPVFSAPWEAQAFAMTLCLYEQGLFTWEEWAEALASEIHGGETRGYYRHWLIALEKLTASKQLTTAAAIEEREQAWHDAAARTPHGQPIEL